MDDGCFAWDLYCKFVVEKHMFFHWSNPSAETHSPNSLSFDLYQTHTPPSSSVFTACLLLTTMGGPSETTVPPRVWMYFFPFFILPPSLLVHLCLSCAVVALSSGAFRSLARAPWRRCILLWGKQGEERKDGRGGKWGGVGQMVASRRGLLLNQ